jgi:hypothetical protein
MQEILRLYTKYISKSRDAAADNSALYNYFIVPFSAGLSGFASFLFILIMINTATYVLGLTEALNIGINEVLIAGVGFFLQFTFQFIKSVRRL